MTTESRNRWIPTQKEAGSEVKIFKFEGGQITFFILSLALGFLVFLALDALGLKTFFSLMVAGFFPIAATAFLLAFVYRKPRQYFRHWWEWQQLQRRPEQVEFIKVKPLFEKE
jgi:uncharacterized membrane protein YkgB